MYNHTLLSETCEALGMSQKDLANATGISESTISRYLNGDVKDASWEVILKISDVLHLSLDVVANREAMVELPTAEAIQGKSLSEILIIIRDFVRRNSERLRTIEHEKDAAFNRHTEYLVKQIEYHQKQVSRYSAQFFRYVITIFGLITLCGVTLGLMIMMFVNNRALSSQVRDLQEHLAVVQQADQAPDNFPQE